MVGPYEMHTSIDDSRLASVKVELPFVSVIITNYNYEKYILNCLDSVARQKYPHYECIVVDDHSNDRSPELIKKFLQSKKEQSKFYLIRRESNGGQMAAFKTGLQEAKGIFVVFVDADDILFEDFLISHVRAHMNSRLPVGFTSSNQFQINQNDEIVAGTHPDLQAQGKFRYIEPRPIHDPFWLWATTSSMMFRKAVLDQIMPDNPYPFRICADNYICHFANLLGGSLLIPTVHGCYRRHGENCFSGNPIVGGCLPTGDMSRHPHHNSVRIGILEHLLKYPEKFSALLSEERMIICLLYVCNLNEIVRIKHIPSNFLYGKPALYFSKLVLISLLQRVRKTLGKLLQLVRIIS